MEHISSVVYSSVVHNNRDAAICCALRAVWCLQFRYMLLSLAGLEAPLQLPLGEKGLYGQDCVFVANDWHSALVPVYLAAKYRPYGVYTNARSVMAIHNLRHQVRVRGTGRLGQCIMLLDMSKDLPVGLYGSCFCRRLDC